MNAKRAKKLRKLAEYKRPNEFEYKVASHGKRERTERAPFKNPITGAKITANVKIPYLAYTIRNESKLNYRIAKKVFYRFKKTFLSGQP